MLAYFWHEEHKFKLKCTWPNGHELAMNDLAQFFYFVM